MEIRNYRPDDLEQARAIWNAVVDEGNSFPGDTPLSPEEAAAFFAAQTSTVVAEEDGALLGLYVLHPNNLGRCAHIANASYGVRAESRGQGIGRRLVEHSLRRAGACGFRGLQYNAVVCENRRAIALYEALGFVRLGTVPGGYHLVDGRYVDTYIYFHSL